MRSAPQTPLSGSSVPYFDSPAPDKSYVRVVCRLCPDQGAPLVEVVDQSTVHLHQQNALNVFNFDNVYQNSSQEDVFLDCAHTVDALFDGYNGSIVAYGAPSSGKLYTMFGEPSLPGIVPRVSHSVFAHIARSSPDVEYTVRVSFVEIHGNLQNGQMYDLLDDTEVEVENGQCRLSQACVASAAEMTEAVARGNQGKNPHASHVVSVSVHQNSRSGETVRLTLLLADLAGSEDVGLELLLDCELPVLPGCFGGNCKTTVVLTVRPTDVLQTQSTLRFGTRAKKVQNFPKRNHEPSRDQLKARIAALEKANAQLHHALSLHSTPSNNSSFLSMLSPRGSAKVSISSTADELNRKDTKIAQLEKEVLLLKMEALRREHEEELKMFKLECALHSLNDKFADVEHINDNLRKHLVISEKIIASRQLKIDRLHELLAEQQEQVHQESTQFSHKFHRLQEKLGQIPAPQPAPASPEVHQASPETLPRLGLNLRIVKPVRGGTE